MSTLALRLADIASRWAPSHAYVNFDDADFRYWSATWSTPDGLVTIAVDEASRFTLTARWTKVKLMYPSIDRIRAVLDVLLPVVETHGLTRFWKGDDPGSCGAECECGVSFDGFDTLAEATGLINDHIATETGARPAADVVPTVPTPAEGSAVMAAEQAARQALHDRGDHDSCDPAGCGEAERLVAQLHGEVQP